MKKLITGSMAIGLLFAVASCSSDAKSSSTTTAETAISTDASTADTAATGDTTTPAGDIDTSGLSDAQAQAYTMGITGAATAGVTLDPACFKAIIAQLTDADAQLIVDAGPGASPKLSAEGEALGAQASTCSPTVTS